MITVEDLVFEYPGVRALDGVGFEIKPGSITALVGPNGAGKTTLMRCIAALDRPLAGRISINSRDTVADPRGVHRSMGYLSDFFGLYDDLTVRQSLMYTAGLHGETNIDAVAVAARVDLADYIDVVAGELSRGLRQRLGVAMAILHEPQVVLLDEPASGLDPEARMALSQLLVDLRDGGMTLMVSSHILAELEDYATDVLMLRCGRVVDHQHLSATPERRSYRIELVAPDDRLEAALTAHAQVGRVVMDWAGARLELVGGAEAAHDLLKTLIEAGLPVSGLIEERASLQETYISRMQQGEAA